MNCGADDCDRFPSPVNLHSRKCAEREREKETARVPFSAAGSNRKLSLLACACVRKETESPDRPTLGAIE